MPDRPDHAADEPQHDDSGTPDETTPSATPGSGDATGPGTAGQADSSGDAWASAVDKPVTPDTPAAAGDRPRMGFSGSSSGAEGAGRPNDETPDLESMMQQLLGGLGGAGGGMPDLNQLIRQLGGGAGGAGGQLPDLGELMRQLGGMGGAGGSGQMPDLGELIRRFGGTPGGASGAPGSEAGSGSGDPMTEIFKSMGIDPADSGQLAMLQSQIAQMFSPQTTESRAAMATDVARKTVAGGDADPTVSAKQQREVTEAVQVAQLWIDPVTTLDAPSGTGLAWSRAEWVEATMPMWHSLVEPVSSGVTAAVTDALKDQMGKLGSEGLGGEGGLPQIEGLDLGGLLDQVRPAMEQLAGSMFSAQLGHGVGALAGDVLTGTEVGLPLLGSEDIALLPANIHAFTEGLEIEEPQVRLYLAVREAARARLFAAVPWLGPQLAAAVRDYARAITIDTDAIEEQVRSMDIQNPAAIQEALQHKLFSPTPTPEQQAALARLETSLALVEGWVDIVTEQATLPHLPQAGALGEAMRRRRAGGPAQKTFMGLVGLDLRPRRLKDARNLWAALENAGGMEFRDAPWAHPDIAPRGEDLDDPLGYVEKRRSAGTDDDLDSALDALLSGETGDGPSTGEEPQDGKGPQGS
ncbi:zinc-dependent metalloprotease [Lapillicoccus sp.]|uniref:zinc-dependent metalloprotease n=1 Tax=Lapillicoccus sp. TaxID=1909287 RepID=UPI0025E0ED8C|nr:zinc-dependent metalloprotease [Lapillicoccus sp.]